MPRESKLHPHLLKCQLFFIEKNGKEQVILIKKMKDFSEFYHEKKCHNYYTVLEKNTYYTTYKNKMFCRHSF